MGRRGKGGKGEGGEEKGGEGEKGNEPFEDGVNPKRIII